MLIKSFQSRNVQHKHVSKNILFHLFIFTDIYHVHISRYFNFCQFTPFCPTVDLQNQKIFSLWNVWSIMEQIYFAMSSHVGSCKVRIRRSSERKKPEKQQGEEHHVACASKKNQKKKKPWKSSNHTFTRRLSCILLFVIFCQGIIENCLGTSHDLWPGWGPKRKYLGAQKNLNPNFFKTKKISTQVNHWKTEKKI